MIFKQNRHVGNTAQQCRLGLENGGTKVRKTMGLRSCLLASNVDRT